MKTRNTEHTLFSYSHLHAFLIARETCTKRVRNVYGVAVMRLIFRCGPSDRPREELLVVGVFEGGGAVAELDVNDAGFAFISSPREGFSAFRVGGGEEWSDV